MIPYGRQSIGEDDIAAVVAVLEGDWLTTGPAIDRFEKLVAEECEVDFAVAFSNGTAALHGAVAAAGIGPGDVLATSPLTFMASANCGRYVGASVALTDIEESTWNLDPTAIDADVDALVAVHFAGLPVELQRLNRRPRVVIEDAAHALGARTADGPVGNCARSDMCTFSFHPVKPITTAEGGMVTTNSADLAARLKRFRSHGIQPRPERGGWYYEISDLGFNYRLTDIQAALGASQMRNLPAFINRRNELADRYRALLADLPVKLPPAAPDGALHGYHLFAIRVDNRREVYDSMRAAGIGVQVHYVPIYQHPISADITGGAEDFPACRNVYDQILSLPMFPALTEAQQDTVVSALGATL